jgi:hypothetical protein
MLADEYFDLVMIGYGMIVGLFLVCVGFTVSLIIERVIRYFRK